MWGLLLGLLFAGGLVRFAYGQKEEPTLRPAWRKAKLVGLAKKADNQLTLDQAEDGLVLSREFDCPDLGRRFQGVVDKLKSTRKKETQ